MLKLQEKVLGPEHADTLTKPMIRWSTLKRNAKTPTPEAEISKWALKLQEKVLGPEHPDTLTSPNNLANALQLPSQHAEARRPSIVRCLSSGRRFLDWKTTRHAH